LTAGARVAAVGLLTGWGEGVAALPGDALAAAGGRPVVPVGRPALTGERYRRATRECLLGIAAVEAMLREAGLRRESIQGSATALVFVTAGGYGASNLEFIVARAGRPAGAGTLHFPYTAPSALAAEVAIEFGLTGAYVILIGGAAATVDALWQADVMLAAGRCARALVVAVETFVECEPLWARARWTLSRPLVEAAACALLGPGPRPAAYDAAGAGDALEAEVERRAGVTLSCGPLVGLALARAAGRPRVRVSGTWRGRMAAIELSAAGAGVVV
jgi:hypothetical protein